MIDKRKVYWRVLVCWLHTLMTLAAMSVVMVAILGLTARYGAGRAIPMILIVGAVIGLAAFIASEPLVRVIYRAARPTPESHPHFIAAMRELCDWRGIKRLPRLYVLKMLGLPNACAFGMGLFGQYGIGITQELYDLLDPAELKGVLAHELAHVRCRDVGLMTVISIITGGTEQLARLFTGGKTALGKGPAAYLLGILLTLISRLFFPIGRSAISQEREVTADALGALYVGSSQSLMNALRKLGDESDRIRLMRGEETARPKTMLDDLLISHPKMERRLRLLSELESEQPATKEEGRVT